MENRILKLCLDILEKGNEMVDCNTIRCNSCPFNGENCCLARIEYSVERRAIAETYIKKHTSEERHSTGKTFREVIADIKEGEVWESAQDCFQLKEISCIEGRIKFKLEGVFVEKTDNLNNVNTGEGSEQTFKLQRKQYTFEEAFKAYEEGKEIESCYSGVKYLIQHGGSDCYSDGRKTNLIEFNEIRGKWYINN